MDNKPHGPMQRIIVNSFQFLGIPLFSNKMATKLYGMFMLSFIYVQFLSVTMNVTLHKEENLSFLSETVFLLAACLIVVIMLTTMHVKKDKLDIVMGFLNAPLDIENFYFNFNIEQIAWYTRYQKFCIKVNYCVAVCYVMVPYFFITVIAPATHLSKGMSWEKALPMYWYLPFTIPGYKTFLVLYVLQLFTVAYGVLAFYAVGILYINGVLILHAHCDLMCKTLNEIRERTMDSRESNEDILISQSYTTKHLLECERHEKIALNYFHSCVKWHQVLLSASKVLQELYNIVNGAFLLVYSVFLVSNSLAFAMGAGTIRDRFPHFMQMVMALVDIFGICFLGELLATSSSNIREAAYSSFWVSRDVPYKKSFTIFMEFTMRPLALKTPVCKINLETFINILSAAYSYFNTILEINKQKKM